MRLTSRHVLPALLVLAAACQRAAVPTAKAPVDSTAYADDTRAWRVKRLDAIAGPDGWSTLAGLFWLDSTAYVIGSDASTSTIVLPADNSPPTVGTLQRTPAGIVFRSATGVQAMVDSTRVDSVTMHNDKSATPVVLRIGSVTYRVIERGGREALRVKDTAYVLRREFKQLEYFPLDTSLRVQARLVPHAAPRTVRILNVLGQVEEYASPGILEFSAGGTMHRLAATFEGKDSTQYFVIFRDATSKDSTYPAGRFMYATLADNAGYTILDFNRAFNPPCAFTAFATCPLPPAENVISVALRAGEKRYAGPHGSTPAELLAK
jgi:uncharacterized protein (DUF1684 family)